MMTYRNAQTPLAAILIYVATNACMASAGRGQAGNQAVTSAGRCGEFSRDDVHAILRREGDVLSVESLMRKPFVARPTPLKLAAAADKEESVGVRVLLRPREGMTAERLQAAINCDRAFVAEAPASRDPTCPFEISSTTVTVSSAGDAFAIEIVADDPEAVHAATVLAKRLRPE